VALQATLQLQSNFMLIALHQKKDNAMTNNDNRIATQMTRTTLLKHYQQNESLKFTDAKYNPLI
jgi:hypothetical protein